MNNANPNIPTTPKSALDTIKEWKELIAFVALTLGSVLNGVFGGGHPNLQKASWVVAVSLVAVGAYVIHRKQRRKLEQERREKIWAESEAQRKAGSAFRSLAPFEERDKLPGKDRKVEARAIATRIASDDFRFGVVCGDTGCGKTSMLRSEVTSVLRKSRLEVAYVRNPRRLESKTSEGLPPMERLESELAALRTYIKSTTRILILDQFEEWFIEYQEPEQRAQIGKFTRELAEGSQRIRIVCAIRREFLIDFHDLSDELPQQLSTTNLFHIKNFTIDQAKDVINECATADGLAPDESFAETAAHDLAEGGQVRPPELQIVCTYLAVSGGLNTPKYRQAGGTAGILAHYIQDALSSSKAPDVGARLLRALCDFPARAKRKPRTLDELTADVNTDGSISDSNLKNTVAALGHHFVLGRILAEEKRRDESTALALMHDYLVDAVQLATGDASTKTEEANQLLRYYVAEEHGTIPFRKLSFIRTFAEPRYLQEPPARRLIRKSIIVPIIRLAITAIAAITLAAGLFLITTTGKVWDSQLLARHWPRSESGKISVARISTRIVSGPPQEREYVCVWDMKTGQLLKRWENLRNDIALGPSGKFLTEGGHLLNLSKNIETPLPTYPGPNPTFSKSEEWLSWKGPSDDDDPHSIFIFSVTEQKLTHQISDAELKGNLRWQLTDSADRLVVFLEYPGTLRIYDTASESLVATIKDTAGRIEQFAISEPSSLVFTTARLPTGEMMLRLWNLRTGASRNVESKLPGDDGSGRSVIAGGDYVDREYAGREYGVYKPDVRFNEDGSYILVNLPRHLLLSQNKEPVLVSQNREPVVLSTAELKPADNFPHAPPRFAEQSDDLILFWPEENGFRFWDGSSKGPKTIAGLSIGTTDRVLMSKDTRRAVIVRDATGSAELWDLEKGQLIRKLSHLGPLIATRFTVDDTAVILEEEGDLFSLFESASGEMLVQRLPVSGAQLIYYDPQCRRFHIWNESGQVMRYTEGRNYFGVFIPTTRCG